MNKVFQTAKELQKYLQDKTSIGFVPTMGNLHQGHLSLLERSISENSTSVISIFVNPTQFAENEDFDSYPRTFDQDCQKINSISESIVIFAPLNEAEIYPLGKENTPLVKVVNGPTDILEAELRPSHFDGVTTVVDLLFKIVNPTRSYFGQKDYQQLTLIKALAKQEGHSTDIIGMPIIRENSGLAMSSRNSYLSEVEKTEANTLNSTLSKIASMIDQGKSFLDVQEYITNTKKDKRFNYLNLCDQESLKPVQNFSKDMVLLGNFQLGETKLLDNIEIKARIND